MSSIKPDKLSLDFYTCLSKVARLDPMGEHKEFVRPYRRVVGIALGRTALWADNTNPRNSYERNDGMTREELDLPRLLGERVVAYFVEHYVRPTLYRDRTCHHFAVSMCQPEALAGSLDPVDDAYKLAAHIARTATISDGRLPAGAHGVFGAGEVAEVPALHSVVGLPDDTPYDFIEVKALNGNLALCTRADTEANTMREAGRYQLRFFAQF